MAIWQFRLGLVPKVSIHKKYECIPITLTKDVAEKTDWWSNINVQENIEFKISAILSEKKSWSETMRIWGDEQSDMASVYYDDNGKIEWIGFRVDARKNFSDLIKHICKLAIQLECILMTGDNQLIAPEVEEVVLAINTSKAGRFSEDPISALRSTKIKEGNIVSLPRTKDEH